MRTLESTPPGATRWSTRGMAKAAGLSHTTISRIRRTFGLQPHRTETFKLSPACAEGLTNTSVARRFGVTP